MHYFFEFAYFFFTYRISSGLSNLVSSPKLTHLNISGNKIKDLEELKALENFKSLQVLDLFNNDATSIDNYREKIFALIPSLKYLDGYVDETRLRLKNFISYIFVDSMLTRKKLCPMVTMMMN